MDNQQANAIYRQSMRNLPTDLSPVFACPQCRNMYPTRELAEACSKTNEPALFQPGEIVRVNIGYTWFDGLEHWMLLNQGSLFQDRPTHAAYFVVTSVDWGNTDQSPYDLHRATYSVRTLGIKNGHKDGLCGWTRMGSHIALHKVESPEPRLIEEGKRFVGEVYRPLL